MAIEVLENSLGFKKIVLVRIPSMLYSYWIGQILSLLNKKYPRIQYLGVGGLNLELKNIIDKERFDSRKINFTESVGDYRKIELIVVNTLSQQKPDILVIDLNCSFILKNWSVYSSVLRKLQSLIAYVGCRVLIICNMDEEVMGDEGEKTIQMKESLKDMEVFADDVIEL